MTPSAHDTVSAAQSASEQPVSLSTLRVSCPYLGGKRNSVEAWGTSTAIGCMRTVLPPGMRVVVSRLFIAAISRTAGMSCMGACGIVALPKHSAICAVVNCRVSAAISR